MIALRGRAASVYILLFFHFNHARERASGIINRFRFRSHVSVDGNANNSPRLLWPSYLFSRGCRVVSPRGNDGRRNWLHEVIANFLLVVSPPYLLLLFVDVCCGGDSSARLRQITDLARVTSVTGRRIWPRSSCLGALSLFPFLLLSILRFIPRVFTPLPIPGSLATSAIFCNRWRTLWTIFSRD